MPHDLRTTARCTLHAAHSKQVAKQDSLPVPWTGVKIIVYRLLDEQRVVSTYSKYGIGSSSKWLLIHPHRDMYAFPTDIMVMGLLLLAASPSSSFLVPHYCSYAVKPE